MTPLAQCPDGRRLIRGLRCPANGPRTPADVTALCDAAARAWRSSPPRVRLARFTWRGLPYVVRHTSFRMLVRTAAGKPVAVRWGAL